MEKMGQESKRRENFETTFRMKAAPAGALHPTSQDADDDHDHSSQDCQDHDTGS